MPRRKSASAGEAKPVHVNIAALLPKDPDQLLTRCTASWTAIKTDAVHFASPSPAPAVIDAAITRLSKAVGDAQNGGLTETAELAAAIHDIHTVWGQLTKYVQAQLRSLPVAEVPPILANILMYASKTGTRPPKPPLDVKEGPTSGTAKAIALAVFHALTYTWEWSLDQQTWSSTTSGKSFVLLTGLTPGKTYYLRVKAFLRDGTTTDYIRTIDFIAH